ncbi:MAG: SRPBCC family protein [Sphingopyxis sp.]|uniref:SRPBCC family protein n=1 Tax=Sphingopyxis sp. TaxID=1908224 RepID=UPI002ABA3694|nr:SRPBCC family protein [Sphingopyxis sp.]MDZ3832077.1 SRPBCC family protein [Sphingopyxis sp.]
MTASRYLIAAVAAMAATGAADSATAKIIDQSALGFTVAHTAQVAAAPADVWKMLRTPDKWWSKAHSWSGDAANFWLDSQAGGCFCEKLPDGGAGVGSVQHARVLFSRPGQLLRLSGAFGPLQGEALTGTLTIQIKPTPTGSALRFDYVVGGYMRFKTEEIAPAVDAVIGEQLRGLAEALGGALPPARDEAEAAKPEGEQSLPGSPDRKDGESGLADVAADLARTDEPIADPR